MGLILKSLEVLLQREGIQRDTHFVESSQRNTALVLLDISEHQSYKVSVPLQHLFCWTFLNINPTK